MIDLMWSVIGPLLLFGYLWSLIECTSQNLHEQWWEPFVLAVVWPFFSLWDNRREFIGAIAMLVIVTAIVGLAIAINAIVKWLWSMV